MYYVVIILLLAACVGFLVWNRGRQGGGPKGGPPRKGGFVK